MSKQVIAIPPPPPSRGFAGMAPERRAELASRGGTKSQALGTAHRWTSDEARAAGRAGGLASVARRRARAGAR